MKWVWDDVLKTIALPTFCRLKSCISCGDIADSGKHTAMGPGDPSLQLEVSTWDVFFFGNQHGAFDFYVSLNKGGSSPYI